MTVEFTTIDGTVPVPARTTATTPRFEKTTPNCAYDTVAYRTPPCLRVAHGPQSRSMHQLAADTRE